MNAQSLPCQQAHKPLEAVRIVYLYIIIMSALAHTEALAQPYSHTLMCYNVENLFDTTDDPATEDEDFLPEGKNLWSYKRYRRKLERIAQVVSRAGGLSWPTFVGLIEVENADTLRDLLKFTSLRKAGYDYAITQSLDPRGIDVALLYRRELFELKALVEYPIHFEGHPHKTTRNLLQVSGILAGKHLVNLLVCHMPSRREGARASEGFRRTVARRLREVCDSLYQGQQGQGHFVVMGDFNGSPEEVATRTDLGASLTIPEDYLDQSAETLRLYNAFASLEGGASPRGSYCFRGVWEQLDQIILSESLLVSSSPLRYRHGSARNYCPSYLGREPRQGGYLVPWRTYAGAHYQGGYSDHYPILIELLVEE
ncbi:MAG: endonuclease/exonuclease/phosphatase family protein [Porphyromonadaceae bacterium]|nr:endonuclease/exonuclease/phosphatase family protein [Porphyromonadaceae bacterium]